MNNDNVKEKITLILNELNIKNYEIKLFYSGFHNETYLIETPTDKYQLRIPKNQIVNYKDEEIILKQLPDYLYYENGLIVKKWFNGKEISQVKLTKKIQKRVIKELLKFQNLESKQLSTFNWDYYGFISDQFNQIKQKYSNISKYRTTHGDLNCKNILINKKQIKFIDFEWVKRAHPAFDAACLINNLNFNEKIVCKMFKITEETLNDFIYLTKCFDQKAYEKVYGNYKFQAEKLIKLNGGFSNNCFKYNDLFIKYKRNNGFAFLVKNYELNGLDYTLYTLFEDDEKIIQKFAKLKDLKINNKSLAKVAQIIKQYQQLNLANLKETFDIRCQKYYEKVKNNKIIVDNFTENDIAKIFSFINKMTKDVFSHCDLNNQNILFNQNGEIKIIDWEYASLNHKYFDLASFVSSFNLKVKKEKFLLKSFDKNYNWKEYCQIKVIVNFYYLMWSLILEDGFDININLDNCLKNLHWIVNEP